MEGAHHQSRVENLSSCKTSVMTRAAILLSHPRDYNGNSVLVQFEKWHGRPPVVSPARCACHSNCTWFQAAIPQRVVT
jgi:hypothetical protein